MASFLDSVLDQVSVEETQPAIHLVLSGHMQEPPILTQYRSVWSYTAGAFHLHSGVSKGTFAARVSVDEGAVRIDSAGLDSRSITSPVPTIIAIGNGRIGAASYDEHVLSTYDAEAEQFIKATDVAGKYVELEKIRDRFASLINDRFVGDSKRVLEVGAGVRDAIRIVFSAKALTLTQSKVHPGWRPRSENDSWRRPSRFTRSISLGPPC
jgi:hypothetical protein